MPYVLIVVGTLVLVGAWIAGADLENSSAVGAGNASLPMQSIGTLRRQAGADAVPKVAR